MTSKDTWIENLQAEVNALKAERDRLERLGKMCGEAADEANAKNIALRTEQERLKKCHHGHEWSNQFGDDWTPDYDRPCDCGEKTWGQRTTFETMQAEQERLKEAAFRAGYRAHSPTGDGKNWTFDTVCGDGETEQAAWADFAALTLTPRQSKENTND